MSGRARITLSAEDKTAAAFAAVRQRFSGLQGDINGVGAGFAGLGATIGTVLGGFGIGALVKGVTDGLDRLNDLSDATGASVENISALENVALRTGTSFESVSGALLKFNQALNNADTGDVAEVLKAIGLSAQQLREQDPAQALLATATALQQFADDGSRARAEQLLFGRSLKDVAPLLRDLAEAGALNATVTTEQAEAAERFNRSLFAVQATAVEAGRAIFNEAVPALTAMADGFSAAGEDAQRFSLLAAAVRTVVETFAVLGAYVADTFRGVGREIGALAAQIGALASFDIQGFNAISSALKEDNERARVELDKFVQRALSANQQVREAGGGRGFVNPASVAAPSLGPIGGNRPAAKAPASELEKYLQGLRDALLKTREISAVEQARIDINRGLLGALSEGSRQQVLGLASSLDAVRALQAAEKEAAALAERGRAFTARFLTDQERFAEVLSEADELVQKQAISWKTYGRAATQGLGEALSALDKAAAAIPQLAKPLQDLSAFSDQAARNIQDTLGDSLLSVLEGNFSSIGKVWSDTLKKMVAQAAAAQLNRYLFGDTFGKEGGSMGGAVGELFKWFSGLGARASGGPVQAGRPYLVGERGPELMVPNSSGTVVPNGAIGGPQIAYTAHVTVNGDVSQMTMSYVNAALARDRAKFMRQMSIRGAN